MATKRDALAQYDKCRGFKKAFEVYSSYLTAGEHLSAFVVAFSIFEDRLAASFMLAKDLAGENRPAGHWLLRST